LIGSIHDISEGTFQHMPIISEENYEVSYVSGLELGPLLIQVNHALDLTFGILIAGKCSQYVCYVCGLY